MSELLDGRPGNGDRAQTLLVGAVGLAVMFVTLALVLNTAIHGASLASEASQDVQGGETITFQQAVYRDVGTIVEAANELNTAMYTTRTSYVSDNVELLSKRYTRYYARYDRIVNVSYPGLTATITKGTLVNQTASPDDFNSSGMTPKADWNLSPASTDVHVRKFHIKVNNWGDQTNANFSIVFDDGTTVRRVKIYNATSAGTTTRVTLEEGGTDTFTCTAPVGDPWINVTDGTLNGKYCHALDFFERTDPPFTLSYENGGEINGTYEVVLSSMNAGTGAPNPSSVVYSTTVNVTERSTRIEYAAHLRVAPGEPK